MGKDVIIACDFSSAADVFKFLDKFEGKKPFVKIGMELFYAEGPEILKEIMEADLLINEPIDKVVMHYAKNAADAGLDGVVCSPLEAQKVHDTCGKDFLTITPGVRFADGDIGDQKRVMTPAEANRIGSDYIVVGRPITAAEDPVAAYERCMAEFVG